MFALHPIQTEAVGWLSASGDLLLAIFLVLAVYFCASTKSRLSFASLLFAVMAMFTKEVGVVAPLLIFAFAWTRSNLREATVRTVPYLGVAIAYLAFRGNALGALGQAQDTSMTLAMTVLTGPMSCLDMLSTSFGQPA